MQATTPCAIHSMLGRHTGRITISTISSSLRARRFASLSTLQKRFNSKAGITNLTSIPPIAPSSLWRQQLRGGMASIPSALSASAAGSGSGEGRDMAARQRFAVLITGHAPEYATERYGGYGQMFLDLLRDPGEEWESFYVVDGQFPSDAEIERFDALVVTGSRHDAHADDDWILQLCEMLRRAHARRTRVLGICFGHQVVSRALGGITGRAPPSIGWDCGLKQLHLTESFFNKPYSQGISSRQLSILAFHRDQVAEVPPGGELLASSSRTGIEMFSVGDNVLCLQGHPEFTNDVVEDLADVCVKRGTLSVREAEETKESVKDAGPDRDALQKLLKQFLKGPIN